MGSDHNFAALCEIAHLQMRDPDFRVRSDPDAHARIAPDNNIKTGILLMPSRALFFWLWQIAPPAVMFYVAFGSFDVGSVLLVPPFLISLGTLVLWLKERKFRQTLRPALTVLLVLVHIGMGHYYKAKSEAYIRDLAREMQIQCARDGVCKVPLGGWKSEGGDYPHMYRSVSPGLVPFPLQLIFQDDTVIAPRACSSAPPPPCSGRSLPPQKYTSFILIRFLTDHSYSASGGVGRTVSTSGG